MTTELYNDGAVRKILGIQETKVIQQTWLIKEIIKPELPNLIDHVEKCLEQLKSEELFRMPLTNGNNGLNGGTSIKGTISRKGGFIVDFQAMIKLPDFHRGKPIILKMDLDTKFPLLQVNSIITNLRFALDLLDELQQLTEINELNSETNGHFRTKLRQVLDLLTQSIILLQNPPKELVFPHNNNIFLKNTFSECYAYCESTHHLLNMELVLFKNELSLDVRNLTKVVKKPWSDIDPETGLSFADKIRDRLKQDRNGKIAEILEEEGLKVEETSLINNLLSSFSATEKITLPQANDLLARCVTFDGRVVTECEKVSITTSDPTLISVSAKLNGLENKISNHFTNIEGLE